MLTPAAAFGLLAGPAPRPTAPAGLQYGFRSYGVEHGLRNLAVDALAQDRDGFLWVATEQGLFRFDGTRFQALPLGSGDGEPDVTRLAGDPEGGLWALGPRSLFRIEGGQATAVPLGPVPGQVDRILATGEGLWLGAQRGLHLRERSGAVRRIPEAPAGAVTALGSNPSGRVLLAATTSGLARRDPGGAWTSAPLPAALRGEAPGALLEDALGRIWLRSTHRMVRLESLQGPATDFSAGLPGPAVREGHLSLDPRGRVWTATDAGLVWIEDERVHVLDETRGLPRHWALVTFVDREGSLWCSGDGLHRLLGRQIWGGITRRQGLPSDPVWAILRDREGVLWVGTHRGLARSRGEGWEVVPGTTDRGFFALGLDPSGGLLAAGGTPPGEAWSSLHHRPAGAAAFRKLSIPGMPRTVHWRSFLWDPGGFWWAASQDAGLHMLRLGPAGVQARPAELPVSPAPVRIHELLRDPRGRLWVTTEAGTFWNDGAGWRPLGPVPGLRSTQLGHLAVLADGRLAVAYRNAPSLAILAPEGPGYRLAGHVEPPADRQDWNVMALGAHPDGSLWISSSQGLARWDGQRLETFGLADGLPGEDANADALYMEADAVWVGLNAGLARGDLSVPRLPVPPPSALILEARDGAGRLLAAGGGTPRLPYRDRPVAFSFTAPSFQDGGRLRLEVRLQGFEDAWRATLVREARYTGLPPGTYTFQVRASHDGGPPGPVASWSFTVLPPWWRTWWAALGLAGAGAGLLAGAVRWRTRWLRRRNRILDALVKLRTEDLSDANKALLEANRALSEASMVDALTGLKNRRFLAFHLPEEVARVQRSYRTARKFERIPKGEDMVFLLVDLDHFKSINDTYGHAAGDAVLRQTADLLREACRESDAVARWGGEEFLVVARRTDRTTAHVVAKNIRERMAAHAFDLGEGRTLRRTCSVGFAPLPFFPGDADALGWEQVLELADQCLYAAKESGRDAYVGVYSLNPDADPDARGRILHELPALAAQGRVEVQTSFEGERDLRWKAARSA
jgi:diguanylate cyclase (GGDEF)-like protein